MTRDQLRQSILDGCDAVLNRPVISRFLSRAQRDLLHAQMEFWKQADDATVDRLMHLLPTLQGGDSCGS